MSHIIYPLSWVAIAVLSVSYWFQVWQIHIHREVRDISLTYYVLLAVGFATLGFTAYYEGSSIFIVKQIVTTAPTVVAKESEEEGYLSAILALLHSANLIQDPGPGILR